MKFEGCERDSAVGKEDVSKKNDMVVVRGEDFLFFATSGALYLGQIDAIAKIETTSRTQFFMLYNFGLGSF